MSDRLTALAVEIEQHVADSGWDQPPRLYALVSTDRLLSDEPQLAQQLGLDAATTPPDQLTPVEQEELPAGALDEVLAGIGWSEEVAGCALVHEVVVLPPGVEEQAPTTSDEQALAHWAAAHPQRRDVRLAVAVLRDGTRGCALRVKGEDEIVTGDDLAPHLADALADTLR